MNTFRWACYPKPSAESMDLSMSLLSQWIGRRPFAFSYPYGGKDACSPEAGRAAAAAGFTYAFTMERAGNAKENFQHPFHLARFDCNDVPGGKSCNGLTPDEFWARVPPGVWWKEEIPA